MDVMVFYMDDIAFDGEFIVCYTDFVVCYGGFVLFDISYGAYGIL